MFISPIFVTPPTRTTVDDTSSWKVLTRHMFKGITWDILIHRLPIRKKTEKFSLNTFFVKGVGEKEMRLRIRFKLVNS